VIERFVRAVLEKIDPSEVVLVVTSEHGQLSRPESILHFFADLAAGRPLEQASARQ
jgi:hypothetical protein